MAKFEISDDENDGDEDEDDEEHDEEEEAELSPPWSAGSTPYEIDLRTPEDTPPELSPPSRSPSGQFSRGISHAALSSQLAQHALPPVEIGQHGARFVAMGQQEIIQQVAAYQATNYEGMGEKTMEQQALAFQTTNTQAENTQITSQFIQATCDNTIPSHAPSVSPASPDQPSPYIPKHHPSTVQPEFQSSTHFQSESEPHRQRADNLTDHASTQPNTLVGWLIPGALDDENAGNWDAFMNRLN